MSHNTSTVKYDQEELNCYYLLKNNKGPSYMIDLMITKMTVAYVDIKLCSIKTS